MVDEPSMEDSISILRGIKEKYELHHGVRIKDDAVIAAVEDEPQPEREHPQAHRPHDQRTDQDVGLVVVDEHFQQHHREAGERHQRHEQPATDPEDRHA